MNITKTSPAPQPTVMRLALALCGLALALTGCGGSDDGAATKFRTRPGDCFNDPQPGQQLEDRDVVPCDQPHDNEVFATIAFPAPEGAPFPGRDEVVAYAEQACPEPFADYVGLAYAQSRYSLLPAVPTEKSWAEGDRQIVCALYDDQLGQITGSARGSGI